jgi:protoporphyrinogen oxidase
MTKLNVAVIGAGPAGMTSAYTLTKKSIKVDVFESTSSVGGMAKTIDLWDQKVDIGPHRFFSSDTRINRLWLEVVGEDYEMVDRLTRIYYNKSFFYYPIKAMNALMNLGIIEAVKCVLYYAKEKISPTKDTSNFEGWVTNRFGKRLYEVFFKTYTEKLWGIPCTELDADFAAQRIKKFSLGEAMKSAIFGNSGKHKTLVDQFAYPHEGTGMVYERMSKYVQGNGGELHLDSPVQRILMEGKKVTGIELVDGSVKYYDKIVSSMPLTLMVSRLPGVPDEVKEAVTSLKFRNTILVYLNVKAKDLFPDNWLYIHSSELKMGRLTNFRNWVPQINGDSENTICALEYWCYDEDDFWSWSEDQLLDLAKEELRKTGLIGDAEIIDGKSYRIPKCYPVYSTGYKSKLTLVENYLKGIENLEVIGRYGAFKYNNQDHSILMGLLAAENIADDKSHDLWQINTDYDDYQESSVITKTGLQKQ